MTAQLENIMEILNLVLHVPENTEKKSACDVRMEIREILVVQNRSTRSTRFKSDTYQTLCWHSM